MPRRQLERIYQEAKMPIRRAQKFKVTPKTGQTAAAPATRGFASLGAQLQAIARYFADPRMSDYRLVRAPTGLGEGPDPSSGGFLVAPQYATELVAFAYEEAVLAPLCDRRATAAPLVRSRCPASMNRVELMAAGGEGRWLIG
jgi:hypothetical protein